MTVDIIGSRRYAATWWTEGAAAEFCHESSAPAASQARPTGKGSLVEEDIAAIDQVVRWAMLTDPPRASVEIGGLSSILIASPGDEGGFGHRQDLF